MVDPEAPAGDGITVAFSADKAQKHLYAASLRGTVYIIRRKDLETVGSFPATGLHHITTDGDGNVLISDGRAPQRRLISTGPAKP
ncbi:MAG TPA: hypothetical protein VK904_08605 [Miltoncostaeaceae bacterium]|nr:hypothetical protein [Miltoncostaeaceae bacterium]